jgi:hypothetical protein
LTWLAPAPRCGLRALRPNPRVCQPDADRARSKERTAAAATYTPKLGSAKVTSRQGRARAGPAPRHGAEGLVCCGLGCKPASHLFFARPNLIARPN